MTDDKTNRCQTCGGRLTYRSTDDEDKVAEKIAAWLEYRAISVALGKTPAEK